MCACGVVADHSADGCAVGGCDIGAEEEFVGRFICDDLVEVIEDDSGFYSAGILLQVYIEKLVAIYGEVEDD